MSFATRALVPAIVALLAGPLAAQDNPEEILKPSVLSLRNDECSGSGMFLDDKGLILTNAHVACSPLPFRVHALGTVKGSLKELVFHKVVLVGFHPVYDLALLRIDPGEQDAQVQPVAIAPDPPAVHERIWAMGFPGDYNKGKTKILTWGEVRSANRDFFGDRYYDLDISIYLGNSGGPLANTKGQVLGVMTMLIEEGALAIPISEAKAGRFGPLKNREPNRTMSSRLNAQADKLLDGSPSAASMTKAMMLYENALLWDAGNAALYAKVGQLNLKARRHAAAAAYFVRSVQLQPWPDKPEIYRDLGLAFAALKKDDEARATWAEGLKKFPMDSSYLWGELGAALERDRRYLDAACCARIALRTYSDRAGEVNALYKRVESKLTAEETSKLQGLEGRLDDHLSRLRTEADQARRDGKAFMTDEAEKLLARFDGVQQETRKPDPVNRARPPEPKTPAYTDAELDARFVRGRVDVAKEHIRSGRTEKAIEILEDVVKTYPAEPETEGARRLLKLLGKP